MKKEIINNSKIVTIDWNFEKKFMFYFLLFFSILSFLIILLSKDIRINEEEILLNSIGERVVIGLIILGVIFLPLFLFVYFFYYPMRIIITKDKNNNLIINKRSSFFKINELKILASKNPILIARRRKLRGTTIFLGKKYELIFRFNENANIRDYTLLSLNSFFMEGIGIRAIFKEDSIKEISKFLNIKLKIEE